MSDPHVLLVLASAGWGGTERAVVDLAEGLARRTRVTLLVPEGAACRARLAPEVGVSTLRDGSRRDPRVIRHLARSIRELGVDVVHSHAARAAEMAFWARAPAHVATKHNTRPRWIFRRIRHVTAVSTAAADSVGGGGRVEVIPNGVAIAPGTSSPPPLPDGATFELLAVGRLHRHKGFDTLLEQVAGLTFPWRLRIAGDGPERSALTAKIGALGLGDRVELLGHREDVGDLAAASHLQVVSSRTEGFSLALIEGLARCPAVISTPVGVAPEILPDRLLAAPDRLGKAVADARARYPAYVSAVRETREIARERFDPERVVTAYLDMYARAMAG